MRNLKKFLALALAMVMAFSLMLTANAAVSGYGDSSAISDKYYDAVALLDAMGVFQGDEDTGNFRPTDNITRGEVATVIYRIATGGRDEQAGIYADYNKFIDVNASEWFAGYVNYCNNAQYVKGDGGAFRPYDYITGYEVLAMILRVVGYDQNHEFEGTGWEIRTASIARQEGVTKNITEGTLGTYATREVVAEMIYQAIQIPTVSYTFLQNYQKNVLVEKTQRTDTAGIWVQETWDHDNDASTPEVPRFVWNADPATNGTGWVYDEDVYNTILYANFGVVGRRTVLGRDSFGRPVVQWMCDLDSDTTQNGGLYVVNNETKLGETISREPTKGGKTLKADYAVQTNDEVVYSYLLKPVKTYTTEVTECQVAQDANGGRTMSDVHEYWNGKSVQYWGADKSTADAVDLDAHPLTAANLTRTVDALHTTTDKIGAQGRLTEIYKIPGGYNHYSSWEVVYIDTLLAEVTEVTALTRDTLGHVYHPATMTMKINDKGSDNADPGAIATTVTATDSKKDYTYKVGDLVLINVYNNTAVMNIGAIDRSNDSTAAVTVANLAKLQWVPAQKVSETAVDAKWAQPTNIDIVNGKVNIVGAPGTKQVTVTGTVGNANDKTGLVAADGTTLSNNVFHAEAGVIATPAYDANKGTYIPAGYAIKTTNNLINRTFNLWLDKYGNIAGMKEVVAGSNIGVITAMEPVRVGIGQWVMEAKVFKADNTEETIRLLTVGADGSYNYVSSAATNVTSATETDTDNNTTNPDFASRNSLIKYAPVTKDGVLYAYVVEVGEVEDDKTVNSTVDVMVQTGVADTLRAAQGGAETGDANSDTEYTKTVLDDTTQFIIASTTFDYSLQPNANTGNRVLGGLRGYTGFKTIPTIMGLTGSVQMAKIDDTYYVYPLVDGDLAITGAGASYSFAAQPTITVDETYLVLSTIATYADHAEYNALVNGQPKVLKVANINDAASNQGLNERVETAKAAGELIRVTGTDLDGNATAITFVEQTENLGKCDNASGALTVLTGAHLKFSALDTANTAVTTVIPAQVGGNDVAVTVANGVMTLTCNSATVYLTIDANCQVQIVNTVLGTYYAGTLDSVNQYRRITTATPIHELVYEVNNLGYVCNIYIMD